MKTLSLIITIIALAISANSATASREKILISKSDGPIFLPSSAKSVQNGTDDGTIICWITGKNNGTLYAQKINLLNSVLWEYNGAVLDSNLGEGFSENSDYPLIFSDKEGGAVIIYRKKFSNAEDIFLQKINSDGFSAHAPVCLSSGYSGYSFSPTAAMTPFNDIIITWENFEGGDFDIYAQKVDRYGNKVWNHGKEVVVCNASGDQRKPTIVCDPGNSCFITWLDTRENTEHAFDLYANRLSATGRSLGFGSIGKLIYRKNSGNNTESRKEIFYNHNIILSDKNTFIVALENSDDNLFSSVIAIRVSSRLDKVWEVNFRSGSRQSNPLIVTDGKGGANIFWNDKTETISEIFGGGLDRSGTHTWGGNHGTIISQDNSMRSYSKILPTEQIQNGVYYENGKVHLTWVTPQSRSLYFKSIHLTDESKNKIADTIENGVSEGEYTSVTTQMENLIVVYNQSNNLYVLCRKLNNDLQDARHQNIIIDNFPNPFNPSTKITYSIPSDGFVRLSVFDLTGKLISTPEEGFRTSGNYNVTFDGNNLATGVYFYRLEMNGYTVTKKMTLIK
ncbi:MAG: T9SS type A sorting domain-containing protein [bacterium]|nr:T9SS type A sorting domain-containing protein [bacterium]